MSSEFELGQRLNENPPSDSANASSDEPKSSWSSWEALQGIFETPIFYIVKGTCIACLVSSWAIFCAACLNISLQIIFTFENGYENSSNLWMYRVFQGILLPNLFVLWAIICAYILSRQSELIYIVYLTPFYSDASIHNARIAVGRLVLSENFLDPVFSEKSQPLTIYISYFLSGALGVVGIAMIFWYGFDFSISVLEKVVYTGLWMIIWAIVFCNYRINPHTHRLFAVQSILVAFGLFSVIVWLSLNKTKNFGYPESFYDKLVLVFTAISTCVSAIYIFFEVWCLPCAMLLGSSPSGTGKQVADSVLMKRLENSSPIYEWWEKWILVLHSNKTSIDNNSQLYYFKIALVLMIVALCIIFVPLCISFTCFMQQHHVGMDYNCRMIAEWMIIIFTFTSNIVNGSRQIYERFTNTSQDNNASTNSQENETTIIIIILKYLKLFLDWLNLYGRYVFVLLLFLLFLIAGLYQADVSDHVVWASDVFLLLAGFAVFGIIFVYPEYSAFFTLAVGFILGGFLNFPAAVYLTMILSHGWVLFRHYEMLRNGNEHKNDCPGCVNCYYMQINTCFTHRQSPTSESSSGKGSKDTRSDGHKRIYEGLFLMFVLLNAILYTLAIWTQEQDSEMLGTSLHYVHADDLVTSRKVPYALCGAEYYSLNVVDLGFLTELTYLKDPVNSAIDCGLSGNTTKLKLCLENYFTPQYTKPATNNLPYNWQVVNITLPTTSDSESFTPSKHAAFYGIVSHTAQLMVVGIRGSSNGRDWLEDFSLYSEISTLQLVSSVIPLVYVWPVEATSIVVNGMSYISSISFLQRNPARNQNKKFLVSAYYDQVSSFTSEMLQEYPNYEILVIGHSLGGATAGIVGAKMNITSVTFEPPGIVYSKVKFNIAGGTQDIYDTSTNIVREYDPVAMVDLQGGDTQRITCPTGGISAYCHSIHPITCHLLANCQQMSNSINFNYWDGPYGYCPVK